MRNYSFHISTIPAPKGLFEKNEDVRKQKKTSVKNEKVKKKRDVKKVNTLIETKH